MFNNASRNSGLKIIAASITFCLTAVAGFDRTEAQATTAAIPSTVVVTEGDAIATDVSARRRRYVRRYRDDVAARAFFGAAIGTIGTIVAQQRRQDYYRQQYYYGGNPYYGGRYYGAPGYYGQGYYSGY